MKVKEIEEIFSRLEGLTIDLPHDAAGLGPDFLREAVSKCRGYLNEVGLYYQRVTSKKTLLSIRLEGLETEYRIKFDEILTSDHRVKALASQPQRESMINTILLDERRELEKVRLDMKSCDQVEKVIRFRHKELEQTMSALRIQRSLLKDQLRTGSFYGDEGYASRNEDGVANMDGDDLDRYLEEVGEGSDATEEALDAVTDIDGEEKTEEKPKMAPKKKARKTSQKKHPAPSPDEEGNVSIGDDDIDSLLDGIDETPDSEPVPEKKKGEKVLDPNTAVEITEDDVDQDMEDFLDQDFEDDLDSLMGDDD